MDVSIVIFMFLLLMMFIIITKGVVIVNENQRVVVFRLGKHEATLPPGVSVVIPFLDVVVYVNLTKHIPEWRTMREEDLIKQVEDLVFHDPDPKKYR